MIARLQKFITCSLLMLVVGWTTFFWQAGKPAWGWFGGIAMLLSYTVFLGVEFAMLAFVNRQIGAKSPGLLSILRAWIGETVSAPIIFCWRQPFRSLAAPDILPLAGADAGRRGVILVHGLFCNRGFWNPWIVKLQAAGTPTLAINLEPIFGPIDAYVATLNSAVQRMTLATGLPPVLVGHSMGGLALRAWMASCDSAERVHHVFTIGTPHHGTWIARFSHTGSGRQMRLQSPWLAHLQQREDPSTYRRFTCFYSRCDNIVFPATTATLPGAENCEILATAHVQMAFHDVVFDHVLACVMAPIPQPTVARSVPSST